jgi:hypothetical protein
MTQEIERFSTGICAYQMEATVNFLKSKDSGQWCYKVLAMPAIPAAQGVEIG